MKLNSEKLFKAGAYSKTAMTHPQSKRVINVKMTEEDWAKAKVEAKAQNIKGQPAQETYTRFFDERLKERPWSVKDYFDNDYDKMRSTIFHELGHHIHQMTGWSVSNPRLRKSVAENLDLSLHLIQKL